MLAFASGYGIVFSGLLFTYRFPVIRRPRKLEKYLIIVLSLFAVGLSFTKLVSGEATLDSHGNLAFSVGDFLWFYILCFLVVVVLIARNLLQVSQLQNALKRRQMYFILFAFLTSALLGLVLNVIVPLIVSDWHATRFGPLATVLLVVTIAYTIIRHGLFDIRFAVVRTIAYLFSLLTLAGIYYGIAYVASGIFFKDQGQGFMIDQGPLNVTLALLLAFIFQPVKGFFDRLTNKVFYQSNFTIDDFVVRLSRKLTMSNDLRTLLHYASSDIADVLKIDQAFFAVRYGEGVSMSSGTHEHTRISRLDIVKLDAYFYDSQDEVLLKDTLLSDNDSIKDILNQHGVAAVLPLWYADRLQGYLFLGEKHTGYYVHRDLKALRTIRDELVIAIQNALSVQEVREINATLQQRIKDATKKLRQSNNQLQRLDAAKDEFVSMASHQLRTPLTSVKGYISMVLEGDVGRITKEQRQLLEEAFTSSERMVHLIGDFLNVSRLQTGKFIIDTHPVDLAKVTQQEVDSIRQIAAGHNVSVVYERPARFPELYLDENKIRQVIMNFMDNAIYYSPDSQEIKITLSVEDGDAVLRVIDKGMGVPVDAQKKLFTKFFRAENARKQRPDGTGIGLYLARKVIDGHGGSLVFESKEDKGSTFGFRLPIKKLATPPAPQQVS
jgi:signal transduction histidine kinase